MRKSISKRFKITKTGKILRRAMAQSHFLAKKSGIQIKRKKLFRGLSSGKQIINKYKGL